MAPCSVIRLQDLKSRGQCRTGVSACDVSPHSFSDSEPLLSKDTAHRVDLGLPHSGNRSLALTPIHKKWRPQQRKLNTQQISIAFMEVSLFLLSNPVSICITYFQLMRSCFLSILYVRSECLCPGHCQCRIAKFPFQHVVLSQKLSIYPSIPPSSL